MLQKNLIFCVWIKLALNEEKFEIYDFRSIFINKERNFFCDLEKIVNNFYK